MWSAAERDIRGLAVKFYTEEVELRYAWPFDLQLIAKTLAEQESVFLTMAKTHSRRARLFGD